MAAHDHGRMAGKRDAAAVDADRVGADLEAGGRIVREPLRGERVVAPEQPDARSVGSAALSASVRTTIFARCRPSRTRSSRGRPQRRRARLRRQHGDDLRVAEQLAEQGAVSRASSRRNRSNSGSTSSDSGVPFTANSKCASRPAIFAVNTCVPVACAPRPARRSRTARPSAPGAARRARRSPRPRPRPRRRRRAGPARRGVDPLAEERREVGGRRRALRARDVVEAGAPAALLAVEALQARAKASSPTWRRGMWKTISALP